MALRSAASVSSTVTKTRVCIDGVENADWNGRIFSPYMKQVCGFSGLREFVDILDVFFDSVGYPQSTYAMRSFCPRRDSGAKNAEVCLDGVGSFPDCRGGIATFDLRVTFRNNATWQGSVRWIDGLAEAHFASVLELTRFLGSAVSQAAAAQNDKECERCER